MAELTDLVVDLIEIDCSCVDGNRVWFVGKTFNYLFCMDISEKIIEIVERLPGEQLIGYRSYSNIVKYKNQIILIPGYADKILIYDAAARIFREIEVKIQGKHVFYVFVGIEHDKLYLMDHEDARIVIIDLDKRCIASCRKIETSEPVNLIYSKPILQKGNIYIPLCEGNKIIIYQISDDVFRECLLESVASGYSNIIYDGIFFWLIGFAGEIVKWDSETMKIVQNISLPKDFKEFVIAGNDKIVKWYSYEEDRIRNYRFCWDCDFDGKYIWILPALSDSILCVDKDTGVLQIIELPNENEDTYTMQGREGYKFSFMGIDEERYIRIYSHKNRVIYCVDNTTTQYSVEKWSMKDASLREFLDDYWNEPRSESLKENLGFFLESVLFK